MPPRREKERVKLKSLDIAIEDDRKDNDNNTNDENTKYDNGAEFRLDSDDRIEELGLKAHDLGERTRLEEQTPARADSLGLTPRASKQRRQRGKTGDETKLHRRRRRVIKDAGLTKSCKQNNNDDETEKMLDKCNGKNSHAVAGLQSIESTAAALHPIFGSLERNDTVIGHDLQQPGAIPVAGTDAATTHSRLVDYDEDCEDDNIIIQRSQETALPHSSSSTILVSANLVVPSDDSTYDKELLLERLRELEERERERKEQQPSVAIVLGTVPDEEEERTAVGQKKSVQLLVLLALCCLVVIVGVVVGVVMATSANPTAAVPPPTVAPTAEPINLTQWILETVYSDHFYSDDGTNNGNWGVWFNASALDDTAWLALDWLSDHGTQLTFMTNNVIDEGGDDDIYIRDKLLERFALTKLYFDLRYHNDNDDDWYLVGGGGDNGHTGHWLQPDVDACQLVGLLCDSDDRVQLLHAADAKLQGTLPSEIGLLTRLASVDMSLNQLCGSLPSEIGLLSNHLQELVLFSNTLAGVIPTEIGLLTRLEYLVLDENCLSGTFPTELGLLTNLKELDLRANRDLRGTILDSMVCAIPGALTDILISADCSRNVVSCECCETCCNDQQCGDWDEELQRYITVPSKKPILPNCGKHR